MTKQCITALLFLLSTLSSSAADNSSIKEIALPNDIGTVSAIAYLINKSIIVGGRNGAWRHSKEAYNKIIEEQTFTISPHKDQKLCIITSEKGLSIYNGTNDKIEWEKKELPNKNLSAVFGNGTSIIALDTQEQCIRIIDYNKNTATEYFLPCHQPNWNPTALISCYVENNSIEAAYLDKEQRATKSRILSDRTISQTMPYDSSKINQYMNEALYSPDGKKIVVANSAGIFVWNIEKESYDIIHGNSTGTFLIPLSCSFYSDNIVAILNLQQWLLEYYDIQTAKWLSTSQTLDIKNEDMTYIKRLCFSPDKKNIVVLGNEAIFMVPVPQFK